MGSIVSINNLINRVSSITRKVPSLIQHYRYKANCKGAQLKFRLFQPPVILPRSLLSSSIPHPAFDLPIFSPPARALSSAWMVSVSKNSEVFFSGDQHTLVFNFYVCPSIAVDFRFHIQVYLFLISNIFSNIWKPPLTMFSRLQHFPPLPPSHRLSCCISRMLSRAAK